MWLYRTCIFFDIKKMRHKLRAYSWLFLYPICSNMIPVTSSLIHWYFYMNQPDKTDKKYDRQKLDVFVKPNNTCAKFYWMKVIFKQYIPEKYKWVCTIYKLCYETGQLMGINFEKDEVPHRHWQLHVWEWKVSEGDTILSCVWVTIVGAWIDNWIYWPLTDFNYKN
jgi:hypothetical protein